MVKNIIEEEMNGISILFLDLTTKAHEEERLPLYALVDFIMNKNWMRK